MEPRLGDRQVEEDRIIGWRRVEGAVEGEPGGVGLSVEELAADLMLAGESGDRLGTGEDLEGEVLPPLGRESPGGARWRDGSRERIGLRGGDGGRSLRACEKFVIRPLGASDKPLRTLCSIAT
jgi:hypothetical protein